MSRPSRLLPALLLAALAAPPPVSATTVVAMDVRALVARSTDIVVGEVTAVRPRWSADRSRIVTEVTVRVTEAVRGEAAELTLVQPGGELEGYRYTVEGAPVFRRGEETLLFAVRGRDGRPQVSGLSQGKFDIRRDPATGARVLSRALPDAGKDPLLRRTDGARGARAVTLEEMLGEVRRLAEAGR